MPIFVSFARYIFRIFIPRLKSATHSICVKLLHKHDKLTQCCRAFTLALARLSCYIRQGYTVFTFVCLSVCLWTLSTIGLNGRNYVLFAEKCIRFVCEKLTLFPYGRDIVGNVVLLAFWWYSQVQDRSGGFGEMYKNVTLISRVQRWRHGIGQQRDH